MLRDLSRKQRTQLHDRSSGCCEAMVILSPKGIWTRCWGRPAEAHHMLTKARGGRALDQIDEVYHLVMLCREHHSKADGDAAYEGNLLIEGYAVWNAVARRPVYVGPDLYLTERYGKDRHVQHQDRTAD